MIELELGLGFARSFYYWKGIFFPNLYENVLQLNSNFRSNSSFLGETFFLKLFFSKRSEIFVRNEIESVLI